MPYLTPDTLPSDFICRTVLIPNHIDWLIIVNGALSELLRSENFEQFGSITPEETADRFEQMFFEFRDSECAPVTPIGSIVMFPANEQPDGWFICDGQELSRTDYAALFTLIGTNYGPGDGTDTFNIPNWGDLSPMGVGSTIVTGVGGTAGTATETLTTPQIPSHTHSISDPGHSHRIPKASATVNAAVNTSTPNARTDTAATPTMTTDPAFTGASITATGGGGAHNNIHPVMGTYFLIYAGLPA